MITGPLHRWCEEREALSVDQFPLHAPRSHALQLCEHGPSASSSASTSNTKTQTTSIQTRDNSPVSTVGDINVSGNVNDPALQLATIQSLSNAFSQALSGGGALLDKAISNQQNQQDSSAGLLAQTLAAEQSLAAAQGTGGASLSLDQNKWLIGGVIVVVLAFIFFGRRP